MFFTFRKALFPIEVTELGINKLVIPVQLKNTQVPMVVTELGIVIDCIVFIDKKAESLIVVTVLGIIIFVSLPI